MRTSIVDRTKILTSSDMILWRSVGFFCDRDLYTFLPQHFVWLNSESPKSLTLFGRFQSQHSDRHDQKKLRKVKYIDSIEHSRSDFPTQVSHLRVPAPCRILFIFRIKTDNSKCLSKGRHPMDQRTGSTRFHDSKTIPRREKKPIDHRDSHGGVRCRILFLPILGRQFTVDLSRKSCLQRNPLYNFL